MTRSLTSTLRKGARRFLRDDRGDANLEAIIFFPFLITLIAISLVLYDAFRRDSLAQKASYTIGDMVSRETESVNSAYMDNARELVATMVGTDISNVTLRVSQIKYRSKQNDYRRNWSYATGPHDNSLNNTEVAAIRSQLPMMANQERIILVDTFVSYDWPFNIGIDDVIFKNRVFTRPRFAPKVAWSNN